MKRVAETFGVARSHLVVSLKVATPQAVVPAECSTSDHELVTEIKSLVASRATYGYRRVTAMLNRARRERGAPQVNHKRIYRVMREHRLLLTRHTGKVTRTHDGKVATLKSDLRWCSDMLQLNCWNGERVYVGFVLDCCDREAISYVAASACLDGRHVRDLVAQAVEARFGAGATRVPHRIQFLSDNGAPYTSRESQAFMRLTGLEVCNTPAYSPESNGMAEAFVKTLKRDYVYVNDVPDAATVLRQLPAWFADYNAHHPHKALGMRSPAEFRQTSELRQAA